MLLFARSARNASSIRWNGRRRYTEYVFAGRAQQEHLQQGGGVVGKQAGIARLNIAVPGLEPAVDNNDVMGAVRSQDGLVAILYQHFVELAEGQGPAVVDLHELLYRQLVTVLESPHGGEFALVVKQQAIFLPVGQHVQGITHLPHEVPAAGKDVHLVCVQKFHGGQLFQGVDPVVALGDPAYDLQVSQAAGGTFDIGLQVVLGICKLGMPGALLFQLGVEKVHTGPHLRGAGQFPYPLHQCLGSTKDPGFQQVGQYRDIGCRVVPAFFHGAHAVADIQPDVP
jgi:hypothetical protein